MDLDTGSRIDVAGEFHLVMRHDLHYGLTSWSFACSALSNADDTLFTANQFIVNPNGT
jgi:hypothetical protein